MDAAAKLQHARVFLEMTQKEFAELIGTPVATLQNWEQRRTEPDPVVKTLIEVIFDDPEGMRERLMRRNAA